MSGRPQNTDRQNAIELGLRTYTGTVHSKCGTDQRYTSGGSCIHCSRLIATEQREARKYLKSQQAALEPDALDIGAEMAIEDAAAREARRQASFDDLM